MKYRLLLLTFISALLLGACSNTTAYNQDFFDTKKYPRTPQEQDQLRQELNNQTMKPKVGDRIAIIETDMGTIKAYFFKKDVPELVKNFEGLAKSGLYENVPFHRVVKDFMIQAGDFTVKDGTGGYSYKGPDTYLPNEIVPKYHHLFGTISMAKSMLPVSIGSQFFIVTNRGGAPFLDGNYSPIGQVYEGMDIAEKIADLQVPGTERPGKIVNIKKVTLSLYTEK